MSTHNAGRNERPSGRLSAQPRRLASNRQSVPGPGRRVRPRVGPLTASTDRTMLIDRIHQLRLLLPAMAHETAVARRDNARLRVEAKMLAGRVAELEAQASQQKR
jgi:hypothetical protein